MTKRLVLGLSVGILLVGGILYARFAPRGPDFPYKDMAAVGQEALGQGLTRCEDHIVLLVSAKHGEEGYVLGFGDDGRLFVMHFKKAEVGATPDYYASEPAKDGEPFPTLHWKAYPQEKEPCELMYGIAPKPKPKDSV